MGATSCDKAGLWSGRGCHLHSPAHTCTLSRVTEGGERAQAQESAPEGCRGQAWERRSETGRQRAKPDPRQNHPHPDRVGKANVGVEMVVHPEVSGAATATRPVTPAQDTHHMNPFLSVTFRGKYSLICFFLSFLHIYANMQSITNGPGLIVADKEPLECCY